MSSPISSTATPGPNYSGNSATPGNNPTIGNTPAGPHSAPTPLTPIACETLHDLAKGLGALADGMNRIVPRSGDVLRGAQRKLDDLKFCPPPHDPNDLPFDPGHRTSPELNSDEKVLLRQLEEQRKRAQEVIRNMGG